MELVCEIYKMSELESFHKLGIKNVMACVEFFSARSLAYFESNALFELKRACDKYDMHLFIDMKRMFVDEENDALKTFLIILDEINVDGIYYSDLSVYMMAKEMGMENKLIYQPETLITNNYDAAMYLKLNQKAVCAAKELTIEELEEICAFNPNKIEIFIHGHALMSFSKRPLISNYFDEIGYEEPLKTSYYLKEEQRDGMIPVIQNEQGTHFFSAEALISFNEIKSLRDHQALYGHVGRIFINDDEYFKAVELYQKALNDELVDAEKFKETYPNTPYDSCFYYKKTSVKKEY